MRRLHVYLPLAVNVVLVGLLTAAAWRTGFVDPDAAPSSLTDALAQAAAAAEAGRRVAGEVLADDVRARLFWSLARAIWWAVLGGGLAVLWVTIAEDTRSCGGRGTRLRRVALVGAPLLAALIGLLEAAGVAFAGDLAEALLQLPSLAHGSVAAANAWVNALTSAAAWLLAFAFAAAKLRAEATTGTAGARGRDPDPRRVDVSPAGDARTPPSRAERLQARVDQLLLVGALVLAAAAWEVKTSYAWAATLLAGNGVAARAAEAVAVAQPLVIGAVASLLLLGLLVSSVPWRHPSSAGLDARAGGRALLVLLPVLVTLLPG